MKTNIFFSYVISLFSLTNSFCLGIAPGKIANNIEVSTIKSINSEGEEKIVFDSSPPSGGGNSTSSLRTSDAVGSLPGTAGISPAGSATYNIPIWVSPGINGMQPDLSIAYNSGNGTSFLKTGWTISGLSVITRTGKDWMHHGTNKSGVNLSINDRYVLDGNLLVVTNGGDYNTAGTIYQTEIETFSSVKAEGQIVKPITNQPICPEHFTVARKDGYILEYGNTADSRIEAAGSIIPLLWRLSKITDPNGNYMEYEYYEINGESVIKEIRYTYNDNQGLTTPFAKVVFDYSTDILTNNLYVGGIAISQSQVLHNIRIEANNVLVRKYTFNYIVHNEPYYVLGSIDYEDAQGNKINSTEITWGSDIRSLHHNICASSLTQTSKWIPGDFNGDGIDDAFTIFYWTDYDYGDIFKLYLFDRNGNATLACTRGCDYNNLELANVKVGDVNGDGKQDLIINYSESPNRHIVVYTYNAGTGCWAILKDFVVSSNDDYYIEVGDFNGDGKADIFALNRDHGTGQGYLLEYNLATGNLDQFGAGNILNRRPDKMFVCDFNGNGKVDIFAIEGGTSEIYEWSGSSFDVIYTGGYPTVWHDVYPGDFNGDGKTDILSWDENSDQFKVHYSTGYGFIFKSPISCFGTYPVKPSDPTDINDNNFILGDYNGDGKCDVAIYKNITYSPCPLTIYYSLGDWTYDFLPIGSQNTTWGLGTESCEMSTAVADFNGDGKADILNQTYYYDYGNGECEMSPLYQDARVYSGWYNDKSTLVLAVTNGYDKTDNFSYEPLTELATGIATGSYAKGSGAVFPVFDYQGAMHVVNKSWQSDPDNNILNENIYRYCCAKIHRQGRGFLCFGDISADKTATDEDFHTIKSYDTDYYYPITTLETKRHKSVSTPFWNQTFYNNKYNYGNGIFFPFIEADFHEDFVKNINTSTGSVYDLNGNLTSQSVKGDNVATGLGEYIKYTENYYISAGNPYNACLAGSPVPNKVEHYTSITTYSGENPYTILKHYSYDSNTGNVVAENVTNDNPNQYIYNTFDYSSNSCGLVSSLSTVGTNADGTAMSPRNTSYVYDNKYRFLTETTNAVGQTSFTDYDYQTGNIVMSIGVDGLGYRYIYDGFGRETNSISPRQGSFLSTANGTVTSYEYASSTGNEPPNCAYKIRKNAVGSGEYIEYYDVFNRNIRTEKEKLFAIGSTARVLTDKEYETGTGRLIHDTKPYYVGDPVPLNTYTYRNDGRLGSFTEDVNGKNLYTKYGYTNTTTTTDVNGHTSERTDNILGQVVKSKDAGEQVNYEYYSHGKPKRTFTDKSTVKMEYDAWANQTLLDDCDAGRITYESDALGQLTMQTDAIGNKFTMEYNELGQLNLKTEYNPTLGTTTTTTYAYQPGGIPAANQLLSMTKSDGTFISNVYNTLNGGLGELLEYNQGDGVQTLTTKFTYDMYGHIENKVYPHGFTIKNSYDLNVGNMIKIEDLTNGTPKTLWAGATENAVGQPLYYTTGTGTSAQLDHVFDYEYNFPKKIEIKKSGLIQWGQQYTWNTQTGNLIYRTQLNHPLYEMFNYDGYDRQLLGKTSSGTGFLITMDTEGNISNKSDVGDYIYGFNKHGVTQITSPNVPPNEPISQDQQDIRYNALNKVNYIAEGSYHLEEVVYGPDEERFKTDLMNSNGDHKIKYFGPGYEYIPASPPNPLAPVKRQLNYVYCPYGLVAVVEMDGGLNKYVNYIGNDYLGSICAVFDNFGNMVQETSFDAWGRRRDPLTWDVYDHHNPAPSPLMFERGYTGHEHLEQFYLINMNGRMYDPAIARMLSCDNYNNMPLNSMGLNRYAYAGNNPLRYTDPTGQWFGYDDAIAAVAGFIIGYVAHGVYTNDWGWNALAAGGIGAVSGWLAYNTAGAVAYVLPYGGILGGATAGAAGGAVGGFVGGFGEGLINGVGVDGSLQYGLRGAAFGAVGGAVFGGVAGWAGTGSNQNPWTGRPSSYTMAEPIPTQTIPNESPNLQPIPPSNTPSNLSKLPPNNSIPRTNGTDGIKMATSNEIVFGNNPNQTYHTFRHVVDAGLDPVQVQSAINSNLTTSASAIPSGVPVNITINVQGTSITYTAYKLPSGLINVGRITVP